MSGDGWIDARERVPEDDRDVAVLGGPPGRMWVSRVTRGGMCTLGNGARVWRDMWQPIAWCELVLPAPPPCWPPPGARLAGLRRELAELAARRDEASNVALDCGMEIRRVEAEIARIEGGGR